MLLPVDPDRSAKQIRTNIAKQLGVDIAVIINDSFGKPDRHGSIGTAIGFNGIRFVEQRKQTDLYNNESRSVIAVVDEVAAAASLVMGQADEALPAIIVRGVRYTGDNQSGIRDLLISTE